MRTAYKKISISNGLVKHDLCIEIAYQKEIVYKVNAVEEQKETPLPDSFAQEVFFGKKEGIYVFCLLSGHRISMQGLAGNCKNSLRADHKLYGTGKTCRKSESMQGCGEGLP